MNRNIPLLTILLLALPSPANAGGAITGGATEITQIANNGELAAQVSAQIRTYEQLRREFALLLENDRLLDEIAYGGNFTEILRSLHQSIRHDSVISYVAQNINEDYSSKYPAYTEYVLYNHGIPDGGMANFLHWENQNRSNVTQAMRTLNVNANQMLTEEQMLSTLRRQARTTRSRKAIAQLGNNLTLAQLEQSRRMENLLQTQIAMQANFEAAEADREMRETAAREKRYEDSDQYIEMIRRNREVRQRQKPSYSTGANIPRVYETQ